MLEQKKIASYDIARDRTIDGLRTQINNAMVNGWKPIGGLCTAFIPIEFMQAMVKEQTND